MRIVAVMPAVPHPFGDTAARWFYVLLKELAGRGHQVRAIVATEESQQRIDDAQPWLAPLEQKLTLHLHRLKVDPVALRRKWQNLVRPSSEMIQDVGLTALLKRELQRGYDVLHLEQMSTGWLGVDVPRALLNVHYFDRLDRGACEPATLGERKALLQAQRATKYLLHHIEAVRLLTPRLKEFAESINPRGRYWVVPFALDTSLYPLQPFVQEQVVGLIGSMHWQPSRAAAERLINQVWPLLKQRVPHARLFIAGWNAAQTLQRYARLPGITLSSDLAHPTDFFSRVAVMVYAPPAGSGMKVKVMESMAYGVPVVTTWEGVEGIDYQNGRECWVGSSDHELADHTCRLLNDASQRQQMRSAARALLEQRYSPQPVVDKMISVYRQLIAAPATASPLCT